MITLHLTADGMGDNATELDYGAFVAFVTEHLGEAAGLEVEVEVEAARYGEGGDTRVTGADPDVAEAVRNAAQELWERWCSEGAPQAKREGES